MLIDFRAALSYQLSQDIFGQVTRPVKAEGVT